MQSNNEWMYWGELAHEIYPVGGGERIASFPSKEQAERVISLHNKALRAQADARPVARTLPPDVLDVLRFYAHGHHFGLSDDTAWDTVSGEPQNFWCDEAGTATVEDGSIAKALLQGAPMEAEEPCAPVDGEVYVAQDSAHPAEASAPGLSDEEIFELWCSIPTLGGIDDDIVPFARALLARASAATVAEPSEPWRGACPHTTANTACRICREKHGDGYDQRKGTQQQLEPK